MSFSPVWILQVEDWAKTAEFYPVDTDLAIDIETSGLSPFLNSIAIIQLCNRDGDVTILQVQGRELPKSFREWLIKHKLVGHNVASFDAIFLKQQGTKIFNANWYDTLVGELCCLKTGRRDVRVSLDATLRRRFTSSKNRKSEAVDHGSWMNAELTPDQIEYAANDVRSLLQLMDKQQAYAKADGPAMVLALEVEQSILKASMAMTFNGLPISTDKVREIRARMTSDRADKAMVIAQYPGMQDVLLSSPAQVQAALNTHYGQRLTSVDAATLTNLAQSTTSVALAELVLKLLEWRELNTFINKYKDQWIAEHVVNHYEEPDKGERVHAKFWQVGADTGRFTSSDPNLQQVYKQYRYMFQAPPGSQIIAVDYSQLEVRIAAWRAHDQDLANLLKSADMHTAIAADLWHISPEAVSKDQRQLAKACVFTLLFGGSAGRIVADAKLKGQPIDAAEADTMSRKFFARFPATWNFRQQAAQTCHEQISVTVVLPSGIQRQIRQPELIPSTLINTQIQGAAAAGLKFALQKIVEDKEEPRLLDYLCATVHDELVFCAPRDKARNIGDRAVAWMIEGMNEIVENFVPIEAVASTTQEWSS